MDAAFTIAGRSGTVLMLRDDKTRGVKAGLPVTLRTPSRVLGAVIVGLEFARTSRLQSGERACLVVSGVSPEDVPDGTTVEADL